MANYSRHSLLERLEGREPVKLIIKVLTVLFCALAILGLVHQRFFTSGGWFDWSQFWHHESLIALCFVVAICFLVSYLLMKLGRI